jgi:hypothetical protein
VTRRDATPLGVISHQGGERLGVPLAERVSRRAKLFEHAIPLLSVVRVRRREQAQQPSRRANNASSTPDLTPGECPTHSPASCRRLGSRFRFGAPRFSARRRSPIQGGGFRVLGRHHAGGPATA